MQRQQTLKKTNNYTLQLRISMNNSVISTALYDPTFTTHNIKFRTSTQLQLNVSNTKPSK
jgi:hypothetical protein